MNEYKKQRIKGIQGGKKNKDKKEQGKMRMKKEVERIKNLRQKINLGKSLGKAKE